jgi:hypothetical protein
LILISAVCKSVATAHPTSSVLTISVSFALRTVPSNDSAKSKIVEGIKGGKNKLADIRENKENEMSLTNSKGIKKQIENQSTDTKRENDFSSRRDKQKDLSEDYRNSGKNGEDACQEQKEEDPSISISDVEIQMKNIKIAACETRNIEGQLKKLEISVPERELCERSPMGNEKRHIHNYSPYAVSSLICFSAF